MSNTLSPSEAATGLTRGQAEKLLDMAVHRLIKSSVFQGVPTGQVDEFVKEVGPEMRDSYVTLVERRFQAFTGRYCIPVNYDDPNAIAKAIDENSFSYKYVNVEPANIPLGGKGETVEQVHEVHFGKIMYNRDLPAALKARGIELGFPLGFKFANPLTSLRYAKKFPEKQLEQPRGILFYNTTALLCSLCLSGYDGERGLDVYRYHPGVRWDEDVRFLVVPEVQPLAA